MQLTTVILVRGGTQSMLSALILTTPRLFRYHLQVSRQKHMKLTGDMRVMTMTRFHRARGATSRVPGKDF